MAIKKGEDIKKERSIFFKTFSLAWELGYTIAAPIVIFAFLGRFLDVKYDSSPILLLIGIFFAMIVSGAMIFRKAKRIIDEAGK